MRKVFEETTYFQKQKGPENEISWIFPQLCLAEIYYWERINIVIGTLEGLSLVNASATFSFSICLL